LRQLRSFLDTFRAFPCGMLPSLAGSTCPGHILRLRLALRTALALPLIGTLDSARAQVVMESLLTEIVSARAQFAIIDITGVPTVDTLVAQHLIKTVSAARLMGAECIISDIRPQIAQTIVHLALDLNVISKATMADAFQVALRRFGKVVVDRIV
jgi:rsbT co-antagonist protein RsbR